MTLVQDIRVIAENHAEILRKAGIQTMPFTNPPLAAEIATLNMSREGIIRFWPGQADVDIAIDASHRQAVITIDERKRKITRSWNMNHEMKKPSNDHIKRSFPVDVPNARLVKSEVKVTHSYPAYSSRLAQAKNYKVTATVSARAAKQSFLVGFDEKRQFIAVLPQVCTSVKEAHRVLRPDGVPASSPRQGEWFFIECDRAEEKAISKLKDPRKNEPLETSGRGWNRVRSSHTAEELFKLDEDRKDLPKGVYVRGDIRDTRAGHHSTLGLERWHLAVRNTELVTPASQQKRRRYWD